MREQARSGAVLDADLSCLGRGGGREVDVGGEEKITVDQEASAATVAGGDYSHCRTFAGENGSLHSLGLSSAITETP